MKADCYETLGVAKGADADDIKRAYRKLAMQFHPDRNPGDSSAEQKFKDLNHAYDILKDEQKRAAYDRFGHAGVNNAAGGGGGGGFGDMGDVDLGDILGNIFGGTGGFGGGRRQDSSRGQDLAV